MLTNHNRVKRGFTLIELLVVIAIIAILAAILFPVFAKVRENARRTVGLSNAKQLGLAIIQYYGDYDETLPIAGHLQQVPFALSGRYRQMQWQNAIYPYVKSDGAFKDPDDSEPVGGSNLSQGDIDANPTGSTGYSATSFIMGTYETSTNADGTIPVPTAVPQYTTPAQFILLRSGQRQAAGGATQSNVLVPDHAGNIGTTWLGTYAEPGPNDTEGMFNQCHDDPNYSKANLPFHPNGVIFEYLDGHVKFAALNVAGPTSFLNGAYPPCQYTRPQGDDPTCTTQGFTGGPPADGFVTRWGTPSDVTCNL